MHLIPLCVYLYIETLSRRETVKREYLSSVEEVLKAEETSASGLSASQASTRLEEHGRNKLREAKKESLV